MIAKPLVKWEHWPKWVKIDTLASCTFLKMSQISFG